MKAKKKIKEINKTIISELINFKLYQTQVSKKNNLIILNYYNALKQISYNFKKVLQLIFQYHFYRKKILIVGENLMLTNKKTSFIFKKTDHVLIPKEMWINGLLSNKKKLKEFLKKKPSILREINRPKLVIFYNFWQLLDSERYQRKVNDITLINSIKFDLQKKLSYFLIGGHFNIVQKTKIYNIFSSFIKKIFKIRKAHSSDFFKIPLYYFKKKNFLKKRKKYVSNNNNSFSKKNKMKSIKKF